MSRAKWKGPILVKSLIKKSILNNSNNITYKKNFYRNVNIPFFLVNKIVYIYNGKFFKKCNVFEEKIGYKFGDFSYTRKHTFRDIKKLKKNKKI
jgi:ribosomal protein S19